MDAFTPFLSPKFLQLNDWSGAPRDTNGVDRVNQASKDSITLKAMSV